MPGSHGYGFYSDETGKFYLVYCYDCGRENYTAAVSSGQCAWCGYNLNEDEKKKESIMKGGEDANFRL